QSLDAEERVIVFVHEAGLLRQPPGQFVRRVLRASICSQVIATAQLPPLRWDMQPEDASARRGSRGAPRGVILAAAAAARGRAGAAWGDDAGVVRSFAPRPENPLMKKLLSLPCVLSLALLAGADDKPKADDVKAKLKGTWELVSVESGGEKFPQEKLKGQRMTF